MWKILKIFLIQNTDSHLLVQDVSLPNIFRDKSTITFKRWYAEGVTFKTLNEGVKLLH